MTPATTKRSPRRAGFLLFLAAACAFAPGAAAQDAVSRPLPAPPVVCNAFGVMAATLQHVEPAFDAAGHVTVGVECGAQTLRLQLWPHDVRSPGFRFLVQDDQGVRELPRPQSVTYRGTVPGDAGSWIAATVEGRSVKALVHMGNGDEWAVQPVREAQPTAGEGLHIVYRTTDNQNTPWVCGVQGGLSGPVSAPPDLDVTRICELACEADFQYFQLNGSNATATQNDITGVVNAMDAIYQADVQVTFQVTTILVVTSSAANPYTSSVAGTLLSQFAAYWSANRGSVQRDLAHLFTGRNMGQASGGAIGVAYLGTVCSQGAGYGVSQSRWTNNFTRRVAVTDHEVGHNFNAQHCDAAPPCYIMCSGVGGCQNVQTTFSQNERNQILGFANASACLAIQPNQPAITSLSPSSVRSFLPGVVTVAGTGMLGVTQVRIGSTTITSGFTTPNDNTLNFNPPVGTPIGQQAIQVTNSAGASNTQALSVTASNPAGLLVNGAVLGGNNLSWSFGGTPNNLWVLALSLVGTSGPALGLNVIDSPTILGVGLLDAGNGMGSYSAFVPAFTFSGVRIYSQLVELVPGPSLVGFSSSTISSTLIFN